MGSSFLPELNSFCMGLNKKKSLKASGAEKVIFDSIFSF
jgi:hypothetical protein